MTSSQLNGSFGDQLRAARQAAGISITELARRAGTSRALIHSYEKGAVSPTVATAGRVLACLGHTIVVRPMDGSTNGGAR